MSTVLNRAESERGKLETFLDKLPGYKGYKAKELRRESDMAVRETLARDLSAQLGRVPALQEELLRGGQIEMQGELGALSTALQTLIDRVQHASKGYAGFYSAVRVKEDDLDALTQFDEQLGAELPKIGEALDALAAAVDGGGNVRGAVKAARGAVKAMSDTFAKRASAITNA